MPRLKAKELTGKNTQELNELMQKERARLRELNFRLSGAQLKSVHEIKETKCNIAVILTILKSKIN